MEAIPMHRMAVVLPFTSFLQDIGAPVERGLRQAGLPFGALDDVNHYVPTQRFWSFAAQMALQEGIEDLGFRVGQKYGANCGDPGFSVLLNRSPTLYHAMGTTSALVEKTISRSRIGVLRHPRSGDYRFFHFTSFDANNRAIAQMDWFGLMGMLGIVRLFTGPKWAPTEIGLTMRCPPCRSIREHLPATRILTSQEYSYINLEVPLLSLPPFRSEVESSSLEFDAVSGDFVGSLKQVLLAYVQEDDLSIEFAAQVCNTSKRSLQRKLKEAGTQYSQVLDQVRFAAASKMLQDADTRVTDIAHHLGYSDAAHFSRAFRRVAGVYPRAYRQARLQV